MKDKQKQEIVVNENKDQLSNYAKELMRPENLAGPFNTTEELFQWLETDD